MPWYHQVATFLNDALPQFRATRRTNLALLTAAILRRRTLVISVLVRSWHVQLPYSHHQRKKRLFRFLSNAAFDSVAAQTALLGPVCQAAKLRGPVPIMIDWSDLGQGRNGLFAAVCFRGRGLPLLRWVSTPAELNQSQNRVEEFFMGQLLRHLPTNIRPLLLADRGFGRASLIQFLQAMPNHTGYPVDYLTSPLPATIDRTGPVGVRNRLGGQRLPERRGRRPLDVGQLEPPAAVPSGMVADFLTNHGSDRARPCRTELDVSLCFAPLLKWVLSWWRSDRLALAIDPTLKGDDTAAIVIRALYRGCAIPVAPYQVRGRLWRILRAKRPGSWMDPIVELLQALAPAAPEEMTVIVLCDRGLTSPKLWRQIRAQSLPRTGYGAIKSLGWQWHETRRTDPARISRHWLVLSVATLLALAYGTRV